MKEFLKKYLGEEQLAALEEAYKKDHPDQTGLPVYVGKKRFDEVLAKQKTAETERDEAIKSRDEALKQVEDLKVSNASAIEEAVKKANEESSKALEEALAAKQKDFDTSKAIMAVGGRNEKAIRALIDPAKDVNEELERIKKSDPYLFNGTVPPGTGKDGGDEPNQKEKELNDMRKAVGLIN